MTQRGYDSLDGPPLSQPSVGRSQGHANVLRIGTLLGVAGKKAEGAIVVAQQLEQDIFRLSPACSVACRGLNQLPLIEMQEPVAAVPFQIQFPGFGR